MFNETIANCITYSDGSYPAMHVSIMSYNSWRKRSGAYTYFADFGVTIDMF